MIPTHCRVKHDPPNTYGDCMRACIACIMDIPNPEDVPHFAEDNCSFEETLNRVRKFVAPLNVFAAPLDASMQLSEVFSFMTEWNPGQYYLLCSQNHVVVCKDGEIVNDPAWYRTSLTQPEQAWVVLVITK